MKNINVDHDGEFVALAIAIIQQAAFDWTVDRLWLARHHYTEDLNAWQKKEWWHRVRDVEQIEEFFRSDYYKVLTNVPGEKLLAMLRQGLREELDKCELRNFCRK